MCVRGRCMWEHDVGGDSRRWCEVDGSGRTGGGVAAGGGSPSGSGAGLSTRPCSGGCGPPCVTTRHVVYARTCWHLAGEESTRWCVVRAGSPAKPYEVVLKLDAKRPSDACLTLGGRPVEFHLARHSAGRPPAPPTRPMAFRCHLGFVRTPASGSRACPVRRPTPPDSDADGHELVS